VDFLIQVSLTIIGKKLPSLDALVTITLFLSLAFPRFYIIERRCGDMHTGTDASLHRVPYFSVIYALHLVVWDLLSKYTIATDGYVFLMCQPQEGVVLCRF
jgi:hypothetical protein